MITVTLSEIRPIVQNTAEWPSFLAAEANITDREEFPLVDVLDTFGIFLTLSIIYRLGRLRMTSLEFMRDILGRRMPAFEADVHNKCIMDVSLRACMLSGAAATVFQIGFDAEMELQAESVRKLLTENAS